MRVRVAGQEADLRFEVRNSGPAIERSTLDQMYPLKRDPRRAGRYDERSSLGLGLYIAREIATAHGGEIEARSDETETVFAVRLPRRQQPHKPSAA